MKDLIEKLGLDEFFTFVAPGSVLLGSVIALWVDPAMVPPGLRAILKHPPILFAALLLAAYTCGHVLSLWAEGGADRYLTPASLRGVRGALAFFQGGVLAFFHWMSPPKHDEFIVEAKIRIAESLERYGGLAGVRLSENPLGWLSLYRSVVAGRPGAKDNPLLQAADSAHRRLGFALGTSLALLCVGLQALLRFLLSFVWQLARPPLPALGLLCIVGVGGVAASFALRWAAGRWWRQELLLTCAITQIDLTTPAKP